VCGFVYILYMITFCYQTDSLHTPSVIANSVRISIWSSQGLTNLHLLLPWLAFTV